MKESMDIGPVPDAGTSKTHLTLAVDFDGVIADYAGWKDGVPGTPREDVIEALRMLRAEGWKIIVHSSRDRGSIATYMILHSIPYDEVNPCGKAESGSTKPIATVYWDDRAVCYSGDARRDLEAIRNFRTWNGRR